MSLGGAEITRVALRQPQLARSLIDVDAPVDPRLPAGATFDIDDIAAHGLSDGLLELAALMLYGEKFRASHPEEVAADVARMRELPRETFVEGIRINMTTEPVLDRLGGVTVPALVLHGADDIALPVAEAEPVTKALAHSRLVLIEGAGHVSPREAPAAVTGAISEFLDTVS